MLHINCDPISALIRREYEQSDSATVMKLLKSQVGFTVDSIVQFNSHNVAYIEMGLPEVSDHCAFMELAEALNTVKEIGVFRILKPDYVLYEFSSDAYCGACFTPLKYIEVSHVFLQLNADTTSVYMANNLLKSLQYFNMSKGNVSFGGLVLNDSNSNIDEALVVDFALHTNTEIIGNIPYSLVTDHCEYISYNPVHGSELKTQSYFYKRLANSIIEIVDTSANRQPIPMQQPEIDEWIWAWEQRLFKYRSGLQMDGSGI